MKKIISIMMSVLLIYAMIFYAAGANDWLNKVFAIVALVSVGFMVFTKDFKEKFTKYIKEPIVIALFSYLGIYILSLFYAKVGKIALDEITKLILSMAVFIITMIAVNKQNMRYTLVFFAGVLGVLGLLNIDLAGVKILSYPFIQIVNKIVPEISDYGIFLGIRIWTAFGNPNLFAPVMAVGILISAYLYMTSNERKEKVFSAFMLSFCQIAFISCVSLGSILVLALALLIYIVFMEKEYRLKSLITLIVSFGVSLIAAVFIFKILSSESMLLLSDLIMILAGIVNYFVLSGSEKLINKISEKAEKLLAIIGSAAVIFVMGYFIIAINFTVPFEQESVSIRRAFYPKAGEYNLEIDADKDVNVTISSHNLKEIQMGTGKNVFRGKISNQKENRFLIDEDVKVAYISIYADSATLKEVKAVSLNGEVIKIPLKYKMLPGFIVDRLQGLKANQSMLQRFVFWEDGLKLFAKAPILGNGIGAFESEINSIRNLNYETRYPHNVGIKVLLETGIIGTMIFIGLLVAIYYTLLKRNSEYKQLKATLLSVVTMLIGHSLIEVNMNYAVIMSILFIVLAITIIAFHQEQKSYKSIGIWKLRSPILVIVMVFCVMYIFNLQGYDYLTKEKKGSDILGSLKRYMIFDPLNKPDYLFSYFSYAKALDKEEEAEKSLSELRESYAYTTCEHIEEYYTEKYKIDDLFELSDIDLEKNRVERNRWGIVFQNYEELIKTPYIIAGNLENRYGDIVNKVLETYNKVCRVNEELYEPIELYDRNINLIARTMKARELLNNYGVKETIQMMDDFVYDSDIIVDYNNDGINDSYIVKKNKEINCTAFIDTPVYTVYKGEIEVEALNDVIKVVIGNKVSELKYENGKVVFEIKTQGKGHLDIKIEMNDASKFKRVVIKKDTEFILAD